MAVNEALNALSQTASSNTPAGSDAVGTDLDDHLRDIKKNIKYASTWPVLAKTADYTGQVTDLHSLVTFDGVSADTYTLPDPTAVDAGWCVAVKNLGAANVIIARNASENIDGAASNITLTNINDSVVLVTDGTDWFVAARNIDLSQDLVVSGSPTFSGAPTFSGTPVFSGNPSFTGTPTFSTAPLPRSWLAGLGLSNGTDTAHDIDIAAGAARDSTDAADLRRSSPLTKAVDANWTEGNGGGFPSGLTLTADTWYRVFVIGKTDGTTDGGFDTSASAANLLSDATGYTLYRQIGWIRTYTGTGPDIRQFTQVGDVFYYDSPSSLTLDNNGSVTADTDTTITITNAPASTIARLHLYGANTGNEGFHLNAHPTSVATASHSVSAAPLTNMGQSGASLSAPSSGFMSMQIDMQLDSSSQFHVRSSSGITLRALAVGWIDRRGRDD